MPLFSPQFVESAIRPHPSVNGGRAQSQSQMPRAVKLIRDALAHRVHVPLEDVDWSARVIGSRLYRWVMRLVIALHIGMYTGCAFHTWVPRH